MSTKLKEKQYHHLTRDERCKIETLINLKDKNGKRLYSNTYISNEPGMNKSTISRELKNRIKAKINPRTGTIKVNPYNVSNSLLYESNLSHNLARFSTIPFILGLLA